MIDDIKKDADQRMIKSVASVGHALQKLRTGRAHPSLLEQLNVEYYGSEVPLNQAANIAVEDSRTLTVTPWEQQMVAVIEKAIMNSDLGLTPATAGNVIRVPLPALTEERSAEPDNHVGAGGAHENVTARRSHDRGVLTIAARPAHDGAT